MIFGDYKLVQTEWKNYNNKNKLNLAWILCYGQSFIFLSMEPDLIINNFKQHQQPLYQKSVVHQNFTPRNNYIWKLYPPALAVTIFKIHPPSNPF